MSRIVIFGAGGTLGRIAVAEAARRGHAVTAAVREPSRHPDLAAASTDPAASPRLAAAASAGPAASPGLAAAASAGPAASPGLAAAASAGLAASPGLAAASPGLTSAGAAAHAAASPEPAVAWPDPGAVRVVAADATDPDAVAAAVAGHDAVIASLYQTALPADVFYARAAHALLAGLAGAGVARLLFVGMAGNLETAPGVRIMDAPGFPPEHRPFALGHTVALHVLRAAETPVDWLMLTPPMTFAADGERTGAYRTGGDAVLGERMSYADFAIALLDEIEAPAHHRTRIAVAG